MQRSEKNLKLKTLSRPTRYKNVPPSFLKLSLLQKLIRIYYIFKNKSKLYGHEEYVNRSLEMISLSFHQKSIHLKSLLFQKIYRHLDRVKEGLKK